MLLAIDIGNTNTKLGVFDHETLISKISTPTEREITRPALDQLLSARIDPTIDAAIISSVVPEVDSAFREFIETRFNVTPLFVSHDLDLGLVTKYDPPESMGTDRLANAFAAVEKYGPPCIVCSFGTATTIDVVNQSRELIGGLIAPGIKTLASALKLATSKLPEVDIEKPSKVIQTTTVGAIQAGIAYGYLALVDGLLKAVKKEAGENVRVIATGGSALLVAENIGGVDVVDKDLTLVGLERLYARIS